MFATLFAQVGLSWGTPSAGDILLGLSICLLVFGTLSLQFAIGVGWIARMLTRNFSIREAMLMLAYWGVWLGALTRVVDFFR